MAAERKRRKKKRGGTLNPTRFTIFLTGRETERKGEKRRV